MSISKTATTFESSFASYINEAVKAEIGRVYDKAMQKAADDAAAKRDEVIAATSLRISNYYSVQDMGATLRIEVTKPKETPHDQD